MAAQFLTPGQYIDEQNTFASSAVAVPTAVPVFIGYTAQAILNGKPVSGIPTRISSLAEFTMIFGGPCQHLFTIGQATGGGTTGHPAIPNYSCKAQKQFLLYNSMRLFYINGGADCYILSVGDYSGTVQAAALASPAVFQALEQAAEPALVVVPDAAVLTLQPGGHAGFYSVYTSILAHCARVQSRLAILDVPQAADNQTALQDFRNGIGVNFLSYGAAYYPWLNTNIVSAAEVDFRNIFIPAGTLVADAATPAIGAAITFFRNILPEQAAQNVLNNFSKGQPAPTGTAAQQQADNDFHQALMAASPAYVGMINDIRTQLNILPPAAAMAGVYTLVDNTRGVWKAPANVSLSSVSSPVTVINSEEQQLFNTDPDSGKSVNVIRPFPGVGNLVWGARTLDGNSQDWRYINIRRTIIMIEQSIKYAIKAYVFEPNVANTWVTVRSGITMFLQNLWKQGALAGASPDDAYGVEIGLGATMTPNDILDGVMQVVVKVAVSRPAEFIVITIRQQQQQS